MKLFRVHWDGRTASPFAEPLWVATITAAGDSGDASAVYRALSALDIGQRYTDSYGDVWEREE